MKQPSTNAISAPQLKIIEINKERNTQRKKKKKNMRNGEQENMNGTAWPKITDLDAGREKNPGG